MIINVRLEVDGFEFNATNDPRVLKTNSYIHRQLLHVSYKKDGIVSYCDMRIEMFTEPKMPELAIKVLTELHEKVKSKICTPKTTKSK